MDGFSFLSNYTQETTPQRANLALLQERLGRLAKATISDGRYFVGTFTCTDPQKNVILAHATEFREGSMRKVGSIMIPGPHLVKFEVEVPRHYT